MKYLAYFRPNRELSDLILRQNNIILPGSGLHFTLCVFYMEPEQEKNLVGGLSQIIFNPFEIETQDFDDFDNDSIVLKLSRPDELLQLHKKVVAVVRTYANAGFDAIAKRYYCKILFSKKIRWDLERNTRFLFWGIVSSVILSQPAGFKLFHSENSSSELAFARGGSFQGKRKLTCIIRNISKREILTGGNLFYF